MSEYVPTADDVRDRYADARVGVGEWTRFDESVKRAVEDAYAEFDAWLAAHDAEVAAKALEEAASSPIPREALTNGTRTWLRARAAEYRKAVQS